jgi:hypothetical protein
VKITPQSPSAGKNPFNPAQCSDLTDVCIRRARIHPVRISRTSRQSSTRSVVAPTPPLRLIPFLLLACPSPRLHFSRQSVCSHSTSPLTNSTIVHPLRTCNAIIPIAYALMTESPSLIDTRRFTAVSQSIFAPSKVVIELKLGESLLGVITYRSI